MIKIQSQFQHLSMTRTLDGHLLTQTSSAVAVVVSAEASGVENMEILKLSYFYGRQKFDTKLFDLLWYFIFIKVLYSWRFFFPVSMFRWVLWELWALYIDFEIEYLFLCYSSPYNLTKSDREIYKKIFTYLSYLTTEIEESIRASDLISIAVHGNRCCVNNTLVTTHSLHYRSLNSVKVVRHTWPFGRTKAELSVPVDKWFEIFTCSVADSIRSFKINTFLFGQSDSVFALTLTDEITVRAEKFVLSGCHENKEGLQVATVTRVGTKEETDWPSFAHLVLWESLLILE